jgi:hypothetical protein
LAGRWGRLRLAVGRDIEQALCRRKTIVIRPNRGSDRGYHVTQHFAPRHVPCPNGRSSPLRGVVDEGRRGSMFEIKRLRLSPAQPRVAQPHLVRWRE